jgi:hypothetical protein
MRRELRGMMIKPGIAVLLGGLLAMTPVHAQSHDAHRHGRGTAHGTHGEQEGRQHCEMHAAKHGAKAEGAASHAGHGSHAAPASRADGAAHGAHGSHAAHGAQAGGMMDAHRTAPKMLLKHREMLQLTASQVEQLEALQAAHKADCEKRMAAAKAADAAAAAALAAAEPDVAAYEARLREAAGHRVDCKVDMARLGQAGAALLTDAQRAHLPHLQHASH